MTSKRMNFDVTPEQEAEVHWLRDVLGAPSNKETVLRAVRLYRVLWRATREGQELLVRDATGSMERLVVPELEPLDGTFTYLVNRPHPWRRQPWVKGRRLLAATVWRDFMTNDMTEAEAAGNWDLPLDAIREIVAWCEGNKALLEMESAEEARQLASGGVRLAPSPAG